MLTSAPALAYFDPDKAKTVSADASSYGLGAVVLQEHPYGLRPVAFTSRTLTKSEIKYAQIEKERLASTWACKKFDRYLIGLNTFSIVTDHKLLVPLINTKDLSETPLRCQRVLMRLMRFNVKARYVPGKDMLVADTLSRSPVSTTESSSREEIQAHVSDVQSSWQVSDAGLAKIRAETLKDVNLKAAMEYTIHGWPQYKEDVQQAARDFFIIRGELSLHDGLLVKGDRIVVPFSLRKQILERIHEGQMTVAKCRERAAQSVWWPRIGKDKITGRQLPTLPGEAAIPGQWTPPTISNPRQTVSEGRHWHLWVPKQALPGAGGLYSRYNDVTYLPSLTSATVIGKLKNFFSHHGVPDTVVSDNGTQFTSAEFRTCADRWNFNHVTSSPHYSQSNGAAERVVKTVKEIFRQDDIFLALLSYRSTPIPDLGASPAELAMGRKLRTTMPSLPSTLQPRVISHQEVREGRLRSSPRSAASPECDEASQFSSKRMERRAGSCRERWWGNALHVHSWYRHQDVTWSELTTSETDPSICVQSRWPPSPEVRSSLLSRPHGETGALPNCVFWLAARCIPGWAACDTSDRPTTITTAVSREHFIFIGAAYTQVHSSAGTVFSVYSHTRSHQVWPHHQYAPQYHARSNGTSSRRGQGRGQELQSKQSTGARNSIQNCYFCASSHLRRQCPAYGKVCKACNKPNHFARSRACKKKAVSKLQAEQSEEYHLLSQKLVMKLLGECLSRWMRQIVVCSGEQTFVHTADTSTNYDSFLNWTFSSPNMVQTVQILLHSQLAL